MTMDRQELREYAENMYVDYFKPYGCEDEWFYDLQNYQINIFKWEDSKTVGVNIYWMIDREHNVIIDDYSFED
jgi:hypothetical protein